MHLPRETVKVKIQRYLYNNIASLADLSKGLILSIKIATGNQDLELSEACKQVDPKMPFKLGIKIDQTSFETFYEALQYVSLRNQEIVDGLMNLFRLSRNWTFRPLDLMVSQLPLNA
jgi:hypothetical protein